MDGKITAKNTFFLEISNNDHFHTSGTSVVKFLISTAPVYSCNLVYAEPRLFIVKSA